MIGWYVHHHGRGHLHRAAAVAAAVREPVVALSSLPEPAQHPFAGWVLLPTDTDDGAGGAHEHDHRAGGALHWAPLGSAGYRERMAALGGWLAGQRPRLVVVDVSVEVTAFVRLAGYPVVVVAGAGERTDAPHELGYRLASRILAPWPGEVYDPSHLRRYGAAVHHVGAISRFDDRIAPPPPGRRQVIVLMGAGGSEVTALDVRAAAAASPGWTWTAHGLPDTPWCDDVWAALGRADVVVTHAGQNALAEVAAARRPTVVVPQQRPFGEQTDTARALAAAQLAVTAEKWPTPTEWPGLLADALELGGARWARWNRGDGAERAAAALAAVRVDG